MKEVISTKTQGIVLVIAVLLLYLPIPFIQGKTIAAILVALIGIYNLLK